MTFSTDGTEGGQPSLAEEQYNTLHNQYRFVYGILAILIEEEGGVIVIPRNTLESYDLNTQMTLTHNEADDTVVIEVFPKDA